MVKWQNGGGVWFVYVAETVDAGRRQKYVFVTNLSKLSVVTDGFQWV